MKSRVDRIPCYSFLTKSLIIIINNWAIFVLTSLEKYNRHLQNIKYIFFSLYQISMSEDIMFVGIIFFNLLCRKILYGEIALVLSINAKKIMKYFKS